MENTISFIKSSMGKTMDNILNINKMEDKNKNAFNLFSFIWNHLTKRA